MHVLEMYWLLGDGSRARPVEFKSSCNIMGNSSSAKEAERWQPLPTAEATQVPLDPRSPSGDFKRTPVRVVSHQWDPRSPSHEFNRTPMQLPPQQAEGTGATGPDPKMSAKNLFSTDSHSGRTPLVSKN